MKKLPAEVMQFFQKQRFVVVSTVDFAGMPHNSRKGIVDMNSKGKVYLLDLYRGKTLANLQYNPNISITAVDEHKFVSYGMEFQKAKFQPLKLHKESPESRFRRDEVSCCLKGRAKLVDKRDLKPHIIKAWEKRIANRITHRLLKNIHEEDVKGHKRHPESALPGPEYMIAMEVSDVVSLMSFHVRQ